MPTFTFIRSRSGSRDGVALLAVLAFILLLTILVVSFISFTRLNRLSTASYSSSVQAQEIAKGGMQDILSDLHQEIIAGSIKDPTSGTTYTQNGTTIYVPATNSTAIPARIGYGAAYFATNMTATTFAPTLIRVSRSTLNTSTYASAAFFTNLASGIGPYTNNIAAVPGYSASNKNPIFDRASWASTATNSVNGRSISAARWNKSFLLSTYTGNVPQPFTNCPPDWVYVTRTGSRACLASEMASLKPSVNLAATYTAPIAGTNSAPSPVIGRYAFVMYDEGALLDANVAGYTAASTGIVSAADTTTGMTQAVNGKSYLSYADLTQLPGMTQTAVDNLVKWRNASVASSGNSYLLGLISYAKNGFLNFQTNDSPFLGRQDLINYFANIDSNINSASASFSQALPYLGTFSRAVSAPSYSPPANSQNITGYISITTPTPGLSTTAPVLYKNNAENPNNLTGVIANRDLANVRFANAGAITHYSDDATATALTYNVKIGDPLLQNRFSLAKINWLSQADPVAFTAPSGNYPAAIQACFGLVWGSPGSTTTNSSTSTSTANGGNPCWNYVGSPAGPSGTLTAFNGTIETLDQVAAEGREPNFFELLKAAILSGSLGLGPGYAAFNNGASNTPDIRGAPYDTKFPPSPSDILGSASFFSHTFGPASSVPVPQRIPDIQIIQIGANIIDQYDTDSYPTAIYFPYQQVASATVEPVNGTKANALFGPVDMVYGDENLPLLSKIQQLLCSPNPADPNDSMGNGNAGQPSLDDNTHSLEGWLQPEIWNPHLQPASALANVPHNFEIRAYGSAMTYAAEQGGYLAPDQTPPNGWSGGLSAPASPGNWIYSNSNIQSYYTGTLSTEQPSDGQNEQAGTITFTDTSTTSSFYSFPRLLVIPGDAGSIPGLSSVTSPLPVPSSGSLGQTITDIAQPNFPYYLAPFTINGASGGYNHFVAFSAGLISETASSPPYMPYYVGSTAANTPISASNAPGVQASICFPVTAGVGCTSYALGWLDSATPPHFHPYSFITGAFQQAYNTLYDDAGHGNDGRVGAVGPGAANIGMNTLNWGLPDPRTGRFEMTGNFVGGSASANSTLFPGNSQYSVYSTGGIPVTGNFTSPQRTPGNGDCFPEDWIINLISSSMTFSPGTQRTSSSDPRGYATSTYYADPDGVIRPGDGLFSNMTSGDALMLFTTAGNGTSTAAGDKLTASAPIYDGNTQHGRRPIILNRPFRSVGELGYAFRDQPFKTLDFFTQASADAALLDVFSLTDESKVSASNNQLSSVVAGQVDLSNAPYPVVMALLSGGSKKDFDPTYNMGATPAASSINNLTVSMLGKNSATYPGGLMTTVGVANPLMNRAALVTQFGVLPSTYVGVIRPTKSAPPADLNEKAYLEAPIRALADVTNTRTWNLMIDIIAQSGEMSPNATTLNDFVVQGERRYWLHIAIDRYTGKIVAQQLEPVYE